MSTLTQYNPNLTINQQLIEAGASKTVYALTSKEIEFQKRALFLSAAYYDQFREAWTGKQDKLHEEFFDTWVEWTKSVVNFDRADFPYSYPTSGASEALRHLIYDYKARNPEDATIHIFKGEYEGYKAYAEAAGVKVVEHDREDWENVVDEIRKDEKFYISQPSAIDGNLWSDFNRFMKLVGECCSCYHPPVVVDLTYVGAFAGTHEKIDITSACIDSVVFSLSKPFGAYYDRIGGVFCRDEDMGLFGNKWFKNLTSLQIGTRLMKLYEVTYMAKTYRPVQEKQAEKVGKALGMDLKPSDVFLLATADDADPAFADYLRRPVVTGKLRLCLTPGMAEAIK